MMDSHVGSEISSEIRHANSKSSILDPGREGGTLRVPLYPFAVLMVGFIMAMV